MQPSWWRRNPAQPPECCGNGIVARHSLLSRTHPVHGLRGDGTPASTRHRTTTATVVVHYRFHPLFGQQLEVIRRLARCTPPAVVVKVEGTCRPLTVPEWMVSPAASSLRVSQDATVGTTHLLDVCSLIERMADAVRMKNDPINSLNSKSMHEEPGGSDHANAATEHRDSRRTDRCRVGGRRRAKGGDADGRRHSNRSTTRKGG